MSIMFKAYHVMFSQWLSVGLSHRYFLYNKPTKVLSPEYLYSDFDAKTHEDLLVIRISQVMKNYAEVRPK